MLVLSRKVGDEIVIDGRIRITIAGLKGDRVKIGVTAPPEVTVDRAEVHEKRHQWAEADSEAVVF
ncbi:MAG: carbon storage regulator [Zavarzinella sp.]|nr:carbon storage regulator [Zavarzinella sp.]